MFDLTSTVLPWILAEAAIDALGFAVLIFGVVILVRDRAARAVTDSENSPSREAEPSSLASAGLR